VELPASLCPTATEDLALPSGRRVLVAKATPTFPAWPGPVPADTHGGKVLLDFRGRLAFAELVILWSLIEAGWDGVWVDSYRNVYRRGYWDTPPVDTLPAPCQQRLGQIVAHAGRRGGPWDVFAWQGSQLLFAESKRHTRDSIRESQLAFLDSALVMGEPPEAFLLVEWRISEPGRAA